MAPFRSGLSMNRVSGKKTATGAYGPPEAAERFTLYPPAPVTGFQERMTIRSPGAAVRPVGAGGDAWEDEGAAPPLSAGPPPALEPQAGMSRPKTIRAAKRAKGTFIRGLLQHST